MYIPNGFRKTIHFYLCPLVVRLYFIALRKHKRTSGLFLKSNTHTKKEQN